MLTLTCRMSSSPPRHLHLPLSCKHQSAYAPSTRASDISRLLDPSYSSSNRVDMPSSSLGPHQTSVYVDHSGDFHDPDYRDFPILNFSKKPRWEHTWSDRDHITEEDEDIDDDRFRSRRFNPYHSSTPRRSTSRPTSPTFTPSPTSNTTLTASSYSPYAHFTSPSPPNSFDGDDDVLTSESSPFETEAELEKRPSKRCSMRSIASRRRKSDSSSIRPHPQISTTARLSDISSAITSSPPPSVHSPVGDDDINSKEHVPIIDDELDHSDWT